MLDSTAANKAAIAVMTSVLSLPVFAQLPPPPDTQSLADVYSGKSYSPYAGRGFPSRIYWGDTHLHTAMSFDAGAFGNRQGIDAAYRFARGEEILSSTGIPAKLSRLLDWLMVADHSDNMGFFPDLLSGQQHLLSDPMGREWYDRIQAGEGVEVALDIISLFSQGKFPESLMYSPDTMAYKTAWQETIEKAEEYNDPGKFTAFIGFEWTSLVKGNNMHRVVMYRDGADKASQMVAYTTVPPLGSPNPRDLWKWMTTYEEKTGGDLLAIAHNGNLSNGIMFPLEEQYDGRNLDKTYVSERAKWEPVYEVTQIKGDGETHPYLSPEDEFADYENWDLGNLDASVAKTDDMLAGEYAREALKRGLVIEKRLGTNPYQFGMIGSTDSHTSLATAQEDNFFGKHSGAEPSPERMVHPDVAWSGDRKPDANGKLPPHGNTVDVKNANWTNTIGASELGTIWTDPEFDPKQKAFYYARVIEIPTPRWSTYDAFRYGVSLPDGVPATTQERAYTSPIWYTP